MVAVADGGVAPRGPADLVAEDQEPPQQTLEPSPTGLHGDQRAGLGTGVEPAQPHLGGIGDRARPSDEGTAEEGGDRTVALHAGWRVVAGEESAVGHHEVDLDRDRISTCLAGDSPDQGVGHDLSAGALVAVRARRVGVAGQRRVHRDALGDRQEPGEVGHRVGSRPHRDAPVGDRAADPSQR